MYDTVDDMLYGQATDDGQYDDVEFYDGEGNSTTGATSGMAVAWLFVVVALAGLWIMGAGVFKGSNQS